MSDRTLDAFVARMTTLLGGTAADKQYSATGPDGPNELYEFVQHMTGGHHHACGEIVYKVKRFEALGNPVDIEKVAAWAFLIWKHREED